MSYLVLARKWRPNTFAEMVGQVHAVKTLSNAIENNRVHHAWLLTGTRGVGKTTLARAFAKALNCKEGVSTNPCGKCECCTAINKGNFVDLIEVDAASKTGVEDTRHLLENMNYAPNVGRYKVYLIDEVHMFSNSSFNALLKTLEEPPEHVKFLFATTDPQKLPVTVISRCIQIKLTRLDVQEIDAHLQYILQQEKIPFDTEATELLAYSADGSMRDALSLLDQAIAVGGNEVRQASVQSIIGLSSDVNIIEALEALANRDGIMLLQAVRQMIKSTSQFRSLMQLWLEYFHQLTLFKQLGEKSLNLARIKDPKGLVPLSKKFSQEELHLLYHLLLRGHRDVQDSLDPAGSFEMLILRLLAFRPTPNEETTTLPHNQPKKKRHTQPLTPIETSPTPTDRATTVVKNSPLKTLSESSTTPDVKQKATTQPSPETSATIETLLKKADNQQWQRFLVAERKHLPANLWYYLRESQLVSLICNAENCTLALVFPETVEPSLHEENIPICQENLAQLFKLSVEIHWQKTSSESIDNLRTSSENTLINAIENDEHFKRIDALLKFARSSRRITTSSK